MAEDVRGHRAHHGTRLIGFALRVRTLFRRRQLERDLDDEIEFHLAMREEKYGSWPAARRQFGSVASVREACRELWTFGWIEQSWQELRYGFRQVRMHRAFAAVTVATLSLGIAATATIYSVCDALVWKTLPLPDPESVAMVLEAFPGNPHLWSPSTPADVADIQRGQTMLASMASWENASANLASDGDEPLRVEQARVTANFFDVLGVPPALGRNFEPGREREAVLSDRLWKSRFQGDRDVVGRSIRLNGENYTVIGVMPASFAFPGASRELWTPLALTTRERSSRAAARLESAGRLKPGHTLHQFAAELNTLGTQLAEAYPETNANRRFMAWPLRRYVVGDYAAQFATLLLGAALFVLLIACGNMAALQLARGTVRAREIALRQVLGAGRGRIVTQLVTESLVLSLAGAAVGVLLARYGLRAIRAGIPVELQRYSSGWAHLGLNAGVLGLALAAAMFSGILASLTPALQVSSLKAAPHRLRSLLVAGQIALTVVLLVGGGLMIRGFHHLIDARNAMEPSTLLTLRLEGRAPEEAAGFYRRVLERCAALPGVQSAAAASSLPYGRHERSTEFKIPGREMLGGKRIAQLQAVSPDYFRTLHIPLRGGRFLDDHDHASAVISEELARQVWPNEPLPVGRKIRLASAAMDLTIVGVAGGIKASVFDRVPRPAIYVSYAQFPERAMDIGIRCATAPLSLATAVRRTIQAVDAQQPVTDLMTLERKKRNEGIGLTYAALLMSIFGSIALALSCAGVYGMTEYLVSRQTHEIGIRMALGAARRNVLGLVFRQGSRAGLAGIATGLAMAFGLARLLSAVIWGVSASDSAAFLGIPLLLVLAAGAAIYVPASRALKIDPSAALRSE